MSFKEKYLNKERDNSCISVNPPFPNIIKIDIYDACNYACVFCPQAYQKGKRGCIDDKLCMQLIKRCREGGATDLALSSTGEPLLNPNLTKYISYAKSLGYTYVFINSNGFLLDEQCAERLLEAGLDSLKISINAGRESYYNIHGVDGYAKVISNLESFNQKRHQLNSTCKLYVSYISTKATESEIHEVQNDVKGIVDDFIHMKANNRGGTVGSYDSKLYEGTDDFAYQYPCSQIFNNIYITAEGYLDACCQDFDRKLIIADLNKCDVVKAWNGEEFTDFRKRYLQKELKGTMCMSCLGWDTKSDSSPISNYKSYEVDKGKKTRLDERISELLSAI